MLWRKIVTLFARLPNIGRKAGLRQSGDLNSYLSSVGNQAKERYMAALAEYNNSKEAQELPYQDRVRQLQNRLREAEEFIRHDLIHQPIPEG